MLSQSNPRIYEIIKLIHALHQRDQFAKLKRIYEPSCRIIISSASPTTSTAFSFHSSVNLLAQNCNNPQCLFLGIGGHWLSVLLEAILRLSYLVLRIENREAIYYCVMQIRKLIEITELKANSL